MLLSILPNSIIVPLFLSFILPHIFTFIPDSIPFLTRFQGADFFILLLLLLITFWISHFSTQHYFIFILWNTITNSEHSKPTMKSPSIGTSHKTSSHLSPKTKTNTKPKAHTIMINPTINPKPWSLKKQKKSPSNNPISRPTSHLKLHFLTKKIPPKTKIEEITFMILRLASNWRKNKLNLPFNPTMKSSKWFFWTNPNSMKVSPLMPLSPR